MATAAPPALGHARLRRFGALQHHLGSSSTSSSSELEAQMQQQMEVQMQQQAEAQRHAQQQLQAVVKFFVRAVDTSYSSHGIAKRWTPYHARPPWVPRYCARVLLVPRYGLVRPYTPGYGLP